MDVQTFHSLVPRGTETHTLDVPLSVYFFTIAPLLFHKDIIEIFDTTFLS